MNPLLRLPYSLAGHLARAAAALAPPGAGKALRSLRARRGVRARFAAWGAAHRDRSRPLLWVHATSVGEGLMARPVLALVRRRRPDLQIAYTFFSPSAEAFARGVGADFADYLPFDTMGDAERALDALRPTVLVFSKLDVWPLLAARARARGVRLGLISATLSADSSRGSAFARLVLADAYAALDAVGAIDVEDGARLVALGARADRLAVTGDTRYDQVWAKAQSVDRLSPLLAPLASERPTLVAGSTWPPDEGPVLAAWRIVRVQVARARFIMAPHEPAPEHLRAIEEWAARERLTCRRLSAPGGTAPGGTALCDADVLLVDRVGVLADLYALASVAYVGGGFHAAGLHSVIEPAAFGVPVLFGPRHHASRDARLLLAAGGGFSAASAQDLAARILALLAAPDERETAGRRARAVVEAELGAAERSAALVERLLATS